MPELQGKARDLYIKTYGEETYNAYNDTEPKMFHGARFTRRPKVIPPFTHRPDHDMESLFWVLVVVLILAKPLNEPDEIQPLTSSIWRIFENHTIDKDPMDDRDSMLSQIEVNHRIAMSPDSLLSQER